MADLTALASLVERFMANLPFYRDAHNAYNEHSTRIEYIDPLLRLLGWDVSNERGLPPQYREVVAENYSSKTDRPDYTVTLRGVAKFFVEAKKPAVDISRDPAPAIQTRKYGWNANHRIAILTNFEYLAIYDTCYLPDEDDSCTVARYRLFHCTEYVERFSEMEMLISRDAVYSGSLDRYLDEYFPASEGQAQQVDAHFLAQINQWRIALSNELHRKGGRYASLDVLNDVVQEFINQIVFLRICEDKNLPLYHRLKDTAEDKESLQEKLEELFRNADKRYNSGMFSGNDIIFDLSSEVIANMIAGLYYPQSPYLFNIIEANLLGKIYELFLTEQLVMKSNGTIALAKKKDCLNRSVVTTPTEIVRYMVDKTLSKLCSGKSPTEVQGIRLADIACGSGIYLVEAFEYLQQYCVQWYLNAGQTDHLDEIGNNTYKLPLEEKKRLLCSCIYGIDIDVHAVEVAKFSLLIKLIEDETAPSVEQVTPILPDLSCNIVFGNSLVEPRDLVGIRELDNQIIEIAPLDWSTVNEGHLFDAIIGNPPYVNTEGMHALLPAIEFDLYKRRYQVAYKQFDKYFIFVERALCKVRDEGYVCYIIPNKFFKINAGQQLRSMIANGAYLVSLDDFGDAQLFEDKTIYSSIILLQKKAQEQFEYSSIDSADRLWAGEHVQSAHFSSAMLNYLPWRLTTDHDFLMTLQQLDRISVPLTDYVEVFNGIQTSAERPVPIYWFSADEVTREDDDSVTIAREGRSFVLEKALLRPYFKPTRQAEKGLNSYSHLSTDKRIIFPYDTNGRLIPLDVMKTRYPGVLAYLQAYYDRLVPKTVSSMGKRDVPNATADTWYQYGRTQALTAFINTPKLIVGVLSKEPMYILDKEDMLIASGGTAGYCAIKNKPESPYALEYIQAWLSNPITERIIQIVGSDFEGGFTSRGTFILSTLPFVRLDFDSPVQKALHERVVEATQSILRINNRLAAAPSRHIQSVLLSQKKQLIAEIERLISKVYYQDFNEVSP